MIKYKVLWFSRHQPTPEQIDEIKSWGSAEFIIDPRATSLATKEIVTEQDAFATLKTLLEIAEEIGATAVAGVIAAPLRWAICWTNEMTPHPITPGLPIYEAWNVMRPTPEGQRTFAHKRFLKTGEICFLSRDVKP